MSEKFQVVVIGGGPGGSCGPRLPKASADAPVGEISSPELPRMWGGGTGRGTFPGDGSRDTSWVARVGRPSNAVVAGGAASVRANAWRDLIVANGWGPNSGLRRELAATGRPGAWPGRLHRQRRRTGVQAGRKGTHRHYVKRWEASGEPSGRQSYEIPI